MIKAANVHKRGYMAVSDEGAIVWTTSKENVVRGNADGTLVGLTDSSSARIEKFDLNREELVEHRRQQLRQREFYANRRGLEKFAWDEFRECITNVQALLHENLHLDDSKRNYLNNLLFSNVITALEVYLQDTLIYKIDSDSDNRYIAAFVDNYRRRGKRIFPRSDEVEDFDLIKEDVINEIREWITLHNLETAKSIYSYTIMNVKFPDIETLNESVSVRHDLIHRNGKTPDGSYHQIDSSQIDELCNQTHDFVGAVNFAVADKEWRDKESKKALGSSDE